MGTWIAKTINTPLLGKYRSYTEERLKICKKHLCPELKVET